MAFAAYLSLIVALVGLLFFLISDKPKLQKIGEYSFFAGLLAFLLQNGEHLISVVGK